MNVKALAVALGVTVLSTTLVYSLMPAPEIAEHQTQYAPMSSPPPSAGLPAQQFADSLVKAASEAAPPAVSNAPSLQGTDVDGGFRVDENGHLIIDVSIKHYIDYYLTTLGESSLEDITANIRRTLESQLPEPARSEALEVLRQYLGYKAALQELQQAEAANIEAGGAAPRTLEALAARLQKLQDARDTYLSPDVAEAFFGKEQQLDRYTLEKLRLQQNEQLTAQEKAERLGRLEANLPDAMREQIQETNKFDNWQVQEAALKERHASHEEVYQLRVQTFGPEAAERLDALDKQRNKWSQRISVYQAEKQQLDAAGLAESDYRKQLSELRSRHFSDTESRRVAALDKIAKQKNDQAHENVLSTYTN